MDLKARTIGNKNFLYNLAMTQVLTEDNQPGSNGENKRIILPMVSVSKGKPETALKAWSLLVGFCFFALTMKVAVSQLLSMIHWR